jgi:hypothetical protein
MSRSDYRNEGSKACPFLKTRCLKTRCEIYNTLVDRCDLSLASYNLYVLADAINKHTECMKSSQS